MPKLKASQYVTSVSQFVALIDEIQRGTHGEGWIFRGQINLRREWPLRPKVGRSEFWGSLLRDNFGWSAGEFHSSDENGPVHTVLPDFFPPPDIRRFEEWCDRAIAVQALPENHWERLALAQHYGLATRLLDWTENPLVGLFFAALGGAEKGWYGAVYALLRPTRVTREARFQDCGRTREELSPKDIPSLLASALHFTSVLTYVPRPFDRRMLQQAAVFTYHVQPAVELEPITVGGECPPEGEAWMLTADRTATEVGVNLIEFVVAPEYKSQLLASLASFGIRYDTLFPDLDGLSRQFNYNLQGVTEVRTRGIPIEADPGIAPDMK